jgi:DNA-binding IclR family transcriptional regulator
MPPRSGRCCSPTDRRSSSPCWGKYPLRSLTGETIVEPVELEKALVEVVEKGYAVEDEEASSVRPRSPSRWRP